MNHRLYVVVLGALLLGGCATTDTTRSGGSAASAYDDGYYVAAHDGLGDYYYDRPQVVTSYDPWYSGYGTGWYGVGFAPWGFGFAGWYYGAPWYWHHHHHGWHAAEMTAAFRPATVQQPAPATHRGPDPFPALRQPDIRARRHEFQHPWP